MANMKLFVALSCLAILVTCQDYQNDGPDKVQEDGKTILSVLPGGGIANTCAWFSLEQGPDYRIISEDMKCQFPPETENTTMFKYCYFSFIEEESSDCIDTRLVDFLLPPKENAIFKQCQQEHMDKCCSADKTGRPKACLDLMNCLIYCSLECSDLCTLKKNQVEEERKHQKSRNKPYKQVYKPKKYPSKHYGKYYKTIY